MYNCEKNIQRNITIHSPCIVSIKNYFNRNQRQRPDSSLLKYNYCVKTNIYLF